MTHDTQGLAALARALPTRHSGIALNPSHPKVQKIEQ